MQKEYLTALGLLGAVILLIAMFSFFSSRQNLELESDVDLPQQADKSSFKKAPELAGISGRLNADSALSISSLGGKVILVDFWTYTCINCIRTTPYLVSWHEKYADDGLVIIGVHTPEFEFEKKFENVKSAVEKYGIKYPVVQDNDYATWRAYENHFWPHKFLIDSEGYIRYDHIGEGGYEETERKIVELLKERNEAVEMESNNMSPPLTDFSKIGTPELYLGYNFARQNVGNPQGLLPEQTVQYVLPESFVPNVVYLEGEWKNHGDNSELVSENGRVALVFSAKNVNIVAGNEVGTSTLIPVLDGAAVDVSSLGTDASASSVQGGIIVDEQRLYNIVSLPDYAQNKVLTFDVRGKGFELYTFTFG